MFVSEILSGALAVCGGTTSGIGTADGGDGAVWPICPVLPTNELILLFDNEIKRFDVTNSQQLEKSIFLDSNVLESNSHNVTTRFSRSILELCMFVIELTALIDNVSDIRKLFVFELYCSHYLDCPGFGGTSY